MTTQVAAGEAVGAPTEVTESHDRWGWRPVAASWLTARLIVLVSMALARYLHRVTHFSGHSEGLLGWDADWYRRIATTGYSGLPHEGLRFFPLFPLLAHALSGVPGLSVGAALLLLSNVSSLVYGALLHRLAIREGFSAAAARRAVWVLALSPAAFVLVMGYAEPLAGVLALAVALLVRGRRWWPSVVPGLLLGAIRPTGVVICLFIAVEAGRTMRGASGAELAARLAALVAPAVGLASYLVWCGLRYGHPLLPFTVQNSEHLRGGALVSPVAAARTALRGLWAGSVPTQAPHLGWIVLTIILAAACARLLPASYTALAVVTIVLGITARDFQSYERYAASAFPLLLAAAWRPLSPAVTTSVAAVAGALLSAYTLLSALHLYVP